MAYVVEIQETDKTAPDYGKWRKVGVEMCRPSRNCGCASRGGLDSCDYVFYVTEDREIAEEKLEQLKESGDTARIREIDL